MFFPRKGQGPLISPNSDRPALRFFLLLCVFAATASAFWWHFERRMAELSPPGKERFLRDADRCLSTEEVKSLMHWRDAFKKGLGLEAVVLVSAGALEVPDFAPGTLFVGVGLGRNEAVIALPPLARKAMGEGPRLELEESLGRCLADAPPFSCLQTTLSALWQHLGGK